MRIDTTKLDATYHQGLRIIHGETKYVSLKYGTRTNLRVRADLQVFPFQQAISRRTFRLFKSILDIKSEWFLGLIIALWNQQREWATEVQKDFKWLAKLEVGKPR